MFKRLSLKVKFILLLVIVLIVYVSLSLVNIFHLKERILLEKKIKLKHVTEVAYGILEHYHKLQTEGKLSEQEAKAAALALIKSIRYEGKEYFWINDDTLPIPKMVMHPTVPALDGKVLDDEKFNCAKTMQYGIDGEIIKTDGKKNLFQAFNEVVNKAGVGYVSYYWPKPLPGGGVTKELYPKLSFVKKFEPWHWVIGTGVYIDEVGAAFRKELTNILISNIIITSVLLLIISAAYFVVALSIIKPLNRVIEQTERIAKGDFTGSVDYAGSDELGRLSQSINHMSQRLREMIGDMVKSSNDLVKSVEVLRKRAGDLAKDSELLVEQASHVATAAEEMSQTIIDIAKNAEVAADTSEDTMKAAYEGKDIAVGAVNAINSVYTTTKELATMVEKLNNRVSEIGDIVTVIQDIADQTNLLALNAAIEAARAGEHGRGFAVVADEVKNLASRTIKATEEISEKIAAIQSESTQTANSMAKAFTEVTKATEYIRKIGESLEHIVEAVQRVKDKIVQIAGAMDEQSRAAEDVTKNIEKTRTISKNMEKVASEVMNEANRIHEISERLQRNSSGFKI
jgi:methyl-accepting chemotaxis protein